MRPLDAKFALYNFKSGIIQGDTKFTDAQLFQALQKEFGARTGGQGSVFGREKYVQTKDEFVNFVEGGVKKTVRVTYLKKGPEQGGGWEVSEVIEKDRLDDVNIKNGTVPLHFHSDIRITTSQEIKYPLTW